MDKRKRGWVALVLLGLVVASLWLVFSAATKNDDKEPSNDQNQSPATQRNIAQGDIYDIEEYIGPSVEEVLLLDISSDDKASKLYVYGSQKLITKLYDKAAVYFEAALNVEGISDELRDILVYERYKVALQTKDVENIEKYKPFLSESQLNVLERL